LNVDISVTVFKHRCLEIIRRVERTGQPVTITRRGKVVAHLEPSTAGNTTAGQPWERLRALGGSLRARPGESVLAARDFQATR
jgi:antitoxin (DNA-binding transcriptional repressor) of toxin-antitoxin stability system